MLIPPCAREGSEGPHEVPRVPQHDVRGRKGMRDASRVPRRYLEGTWRVPREWTSGYLEGIAARVDVLALVAPYSSTIRALQYGYGYRHTPTVIPLAPVHPVGVDTRIAVQVLYFCVCGYA
eukprot:1109549-Rhodomonas_salina.1